MAKDPKNATTSAGKAGEKDGKAQADPKPALTDEIRAKIREQLGDDVTIIEKESDIPDDLPADMVDAMKAALREDGYLALASGSSLFGEDSPTGLGTLFDMLDGDIPDMDEFLKDPNVAEFLAKLEADDCDCPGCKKRRGEELSAEEEEALEERRAGFGFGSIASLLGLLLGRDAENDDTIAKKHGDGDKKLMAKLAAQLVAARLNASDGLPSIKITLEVIEADGSESTSEVTTL